jgi:hypothetical protein
VSCCVRCMLFQRCGVSAEQPCVARGCCEGSQGCRTSATCRCGAADTHRRGRCLGWGAASVRSFIGPLSGASRRVQSTSLGPGGGAGKELEVVVIGGWCGGIHRLRVRIATATFVSSHWSVLAPHKRLPTVVL